MLVLYLFIYVLRGTSFVMASGVKIRKRSCWTFVLKITLVYFYKLSYLSTFHAQIKLVHVLLR